MNLYIAIADGEYPIVDEQLRERLYPMVLPNPLLPEQAAELGYAIVELVDPGAESWDVVVELSPELVAGVWRQRWQVTPGTPPPLPVPEMVSRFQARAALHLAGLLDDVEALVADPQTDMLTRLAWQDAQEFRRASPTVAAIAAALGMSDAQLDDLFRTAAGIVA